MSNGELVVESNQEANLPTMAQPHMRLIEIAVSQGADIVQLEKLMDLQERHEGNLARKSFNAAMSNFQSALPIIEKKGLVNYSSGKGTTNYNYARLEDIAQAIRPALKLSGLSYRFTQEQNAGQIKVTCIITHVNGHSEESSLHSNPDVSGGKDPLKAMASAISYLRRYTLTGSLGIVVGGEDDDGGEGGFADSDDSANEQQFYADDSFNGVFPKWEKLIQDSKKTPDEIIGNSNKRGIVFSPEQLNKINSVSVK